MGGEGDEGDSTGEHGLTSKRSGSSACGIRIGLPAAGEGGNAGSGSRTSASNGMLIGCRTPISDSSSNSMAMKSSMADENIADDRSRADNRWAR